MRAVGSRVYVRWLPRVLLKIVGIETEWKGCVEQVSAYKIKSGNNIVLVRPEDVATKAELFAEKLSG